MGGLGCLRVWDVWGGGGVLGGLVCKGWDGVGGVEVGGLGVWVPVVGGLSSEGFGGGLGVRGVLGQRRGFGELGVSGSGSLGVGVFGGGWGV